MSWSSTSPPARWPPHRVYGTAQKDKEQQAAIVPYRDKDHTAWMAEHQIERAYRDRFTRTERAEEEVQRLLDHTHETVFIQQAEPSAWFFAVAHPERPLPRTAPRLTREEARYPGGLRPGGVPMYETIDGNATKSSPLWGCSVLHTGEVRQLVVFPADADGAI